MAAAKGYGPVYHALRGFSGLFTLGALLTLIPNPQASWPNILGYSSLCTFAPGATLACALLAAITCTLRNRLVKKAGGPVFVPLAVMVFLVAGLSWSTAAWYAEKVKYTTDATAAASAKVTPQATTDTVSPSPSTK